jgi:integrase
MIPVLKDYLWEKWKRANDPEQFVVQARRGGMLSYNTYLHLLERLCDEAEVPRITPHELRHSATEIWIEAGASEEDLRRLLNHKSGATTQRYIHRSGTRLSDIGNLVKRPNRSGTSDVP